MLLIADLNVMWNEASMRSDIFCNFMTMHVSCFFPSIGMKWIKNGTDFKSSINFCHCIVCWFDVRSHCRFLAEMAAFSVEANRYCRLFFSYMIAPFQIVVFICFKSHFWIRDTSYFVRQLIHDRDWKERHWAYDPHPHTPPCLSCFHALDHPSPPPPSLHRTFPAATP